MWLFLVGFYVIKMLIQLMVTFIDLCLVYNSVMKPKTMSSVSKIFSVMLALAYQDYSHAKMPCNTYIYMKSFLVLGGGQFQKRISRNVLKIKKCT